MTVINASTLHELYRLGVDPTETTTIAKELGVDVNVVARVVALLVQRRQTELDYLRGALTRTATRAEGHRCGR